MLGCGARLQNPEYQLPAGLVLWVQLPGLDGATLAQQAEQQGLDIRIGADFSTQDHYADCFRINCGWPLTNTQGQPSRASSQLAQLVELVLKNMAS